MPQSSHHYFNNKIMDKIPRIVKRNCDKTIYTIIYLEDIYKAYPGKTKRVFAYAENSEWAE